MFVLVETVFGYSADEININNVLVFTTRELAEDYMNEHDIWQEVFEVGKPISEFFVVTAPGVNKRTFFSLEEALSFKESRKAPHRYTIHTFLTGDLK